MRQPCCIQDTSQKSLPSGVLLAYGTQRCRTTSQTVQEMPILRQAGKSASTQPYHHPTLVAFRLLGARHDQTTRKGPLGDSPMYWWPSTSLPNGSSTSQSPRSQLTEQSTSSATSYISLVFPTRSLQILDQTSPLVHSGNFVKTPALMSSTYQWHIPMPMARLSASMA